MHFRQSRKSRIAVYLFKIFNAEQIRCKIELYLHFRSYVRFHWIFVIRYRFHLMWAEHYSVNWQHEFAWSSLIFSFIFIIKYARVEWMQMEADTLPFLFKLLNFSVRIDTTTQKTNASETFDLLAKRCACWQTYIDFCRVAIK